MLNLKEDSILSSRTNKEVIFSKGEFCMCSLRRIANLAVETETATPISWDYEIFDDKGMHSLSTNTSRIKIADSGKYLLFAEIYGNNDMDVFIRKNGTTDIRLYKLDISRPVISASTKYTPILNMLDLKSGDYIEIVLYHESGVQQQIIGGQNYTNVIVEQRSII